MNFSELKNKKNTLASLQKKLEEQTKPSFGVKDERMWYPEVDKAGNGFAVIRFLPTPEGEDMPFVKLYSHGFQGPGGWYIENSLTTLGQTDPIGEYNRELWNSGSDELKKQAQKQKRKLSYYSNVYVVSDPTNPENEGKVVIFRYGKKIFDKIAEAVNGNELEKKAGIDPFDLWQGANFNLRIKKVEGYPNYDSSTFDSPSVLGGLDDAQLESIWKREYPLMPLVAPDQFKTYEELQKQFDRAMKRTAPSAPKAEPVAEKATMGAKPKFSPAREEAPDLTGDDEDEDNVMDYFNSMLKE